MDAAIFLDEFRPFRRGEIALARRTLEDPLFLHPRRLDLLRSVLRLAQLSSLRERDDLVDLIGSQRLRMLQLLAPVLPTDPARIEVARLDERLGRVAHLAQRARRRIVEAGLASEGELDAVLAHKQLAVVLGGAAGSGYVFLGALERLAALGIEPAHLSGCSVGSVLAVVRARRRDFDLSELLEDVRRLREHGVFRRPDRSPRFGLPAALRLDLRSALGALFQAEDGRSLALSELAIPTDVLATGLGPGALGERREDLEAWPDPDAIGAELSDVTHVSDLRRSTWARIVGATISLGMSRRVLKPLFFGAEPATASLPALDGAGFSAAIPGLLHYEPPADDERSRAVLDPIFERHRLAGIVDGALVSLIPARLAWESLEAGRTGSRHCAVLALDAVARPTGANAPLAPLLRMISATADRDRPFWDLHVNFRKAPPFADLFPTQERLAAAARDGAREFGATAELLRPFLATLPPWKTLVAEGLTPEERAELEG